MNKIFSNLKDHASNAIRFANENDLQNKNFSTNLLKELNLEFPKLDIDNAKFDIKKRTIDHTNAPYNFHYTSGNVYESYFVSIPISNTYYFELILPLISDDSFHCSGKVLIYQEFSQDTIEGNNNNILNMRENFKNKFEFFNNSLIQQETIFNNFIKNDLVQYIDEQINNEINKRKISQESKDLLNPFK